ncbi:MAG: hypothetical protein MUF10_05095 [Thermoanaerobaculaceae bacterium]|nr:hypothetical protein [Thermoanaerobaculaceae bacterium]
MSRATSKLCFRATAVALLGGLALASSARAQWDEPARGSRTESWGSGRLVPQFDGDRMPGTVPRSWPRATPPARPQVSAALATREYKAVKSSFSLAIDRVRSSPSCASLFTRLGRDGGSVLQATYYLRAEAPADPHCVAGVAAFTHVGGHRCWVCPYFGSLSAAAGAVILIHEALHASGLSESTVDREAPSPAEINRLVRVACSLD